MTVSIYTESTYATIIMMDDRKERKPGKERHGSGIGTNEPVN
jgi:hypothetical protein